MSNKPTPSGTLNSTAIGFALATLVAGLVLGYLMGSAGRAPEPEVAATTPASAAVKVSSKDEGTISTSAGTLRKLSDKEKRELMGGKGGKAVPSPPTDSPLLDPQIVGSFGAAQKDLDDYKAAVSWMSVGNARSASPLLTRLEKRSADRPWRDPVLVLLAAARVGAGDIETGRRMLTAWRQEFPGSPHQALGMVAEGRAFMQEAKQEQGKRAAPVSPQHAALYRKAIERFDEADRRWPEDPAVADALFNKSSLLGELDQLKPAVQAAEGMASRFPGHKLAARALFNAARISKDAGEYEQARALYTRVKDGFPLDPLARQARGKLSQLTILGSDAPPLDAQDWINIEPTTMEALRGKYVFVVFWATWCPHCQHEMPHVQDVWKKYGGDDFTVLALTRHSRGQTTEKVRSYITDNGFTMPVVVDGGATSRAYGVSGIPAAALVDPQGKVVFRDHPSRLTDERIEGLIGKR